MNNLYVNELRKAVKTALKKDKFRYWHSIGVANTCACLAMRYGEDMENAYIAGLLHDCAKCISDEELLNICADNNIEVSEAEKQSPYLLHAKVGALYANKLYNVDNSSICSAIKYHTTGKPDMSLLEQIVFIADYIEPFRNKAEKLEEVRKAAFDNIEYAVLLAASSSVEHLKKSNKLIDKITIETYEYYKRRLNQNG